MSFPNLRAWACIALLSLACGVVVAQAPPSFHPAAVLDSPAPVLTDGSEDDVFGAGVALLGDRMVGGAPYDQVGALRRGAVYAFQREGTQWRRTARVVAPATSHSEGFGMVVAMSVDTLAVTANLFNTAARLAGDEPPPPVVYVYGWTGASWTLRAQLQPGAGSNEPSFGSALGISGNDLLVGSPADDGGRGRVHVYRRNGGTWNTTPNVTLSASANESSFGQSLAVSGDRLVIGAPQSARLATQTGAVYRYERSGGVWQGVGTFDIANRSGVAAVLGFGRAVAIAGDDVLIGAPYSEVPGGNSGAVFAWRRTNGTWQQYGPPLYRLTDNASDLVNFGDAVAVAGDRALIAMSLPDASSIGGIVYVLDRGGDRWVPGMSLTPDDGMDEELFGFVLAMDGAQVAIGAPTADSFLGTPRVGAVYVHSYNSSTGAWDRQAMLQLPDGAANNQFGHRIVVDGDTMLVASPFQERDLKDVAGGVRVYRRLGGRWTFEADLPGPTQPTLGDWFGWSIALKGDIAMVGAMHVDVNAPDDGAVYVYRRNGTSWSLDAVLAPPDGGHAYDNFGSAVAIDGQSQHRVLVSAWRGDVGQHQDCGVAYLYEYDGSTWVPRSMLYAGQPQYMSLFGASLALTGNRAFVGAPQEDVGSGVDSGAVHVLDPSDGVWRERAMLTVSQPTNGDNFGAALGVQQNGFADTLHIGAPGAAIGGQAGGGVFRAIWLGQQSWNYTITALPTPLTVSNGDRFGAAVAVRGDHLLVGAPYADLTRPNLAPTGGEASNGAAYFYPQGDATRVQQLRSPRLEIGAWFGHAVAIGALSGANPSELMIGMPGLRDQPDDELDPGRDHVGRVLVFDSVHLLVDGFED